MFGSKAKELQRQLEEREKEIRELNLKLEEYQSRSDAVVSALTDAKAAAGRILGEAEDKRKAILSEVEALRSSAAAEKEVILRQADAEARERIAKAETEAELLRRKAQEDVTAVENRIEALKRYMQDTAEAARRQAESYAAFMGGQEDAGQPQAQPESKPEPEVSEAQPAPAEKQGESPARLMQNIYAMEGRKLPEDAQRELAQKDEERVWTVDEVLSGAADSPQSLDDELNDIINDILQLD